MFWSSSGHGAADPFLVGGTSEFTTWSFAPAGAPVDLGAKGWDLGSKRILKASFLLRFSVNLGDKILDFPCETDNQNLSNAVLMDILHCVLQGVDFFCALAKLKLPRVFKKKFLTSIMCFGIFDANKIMSNNGGSTVCWSHVVSGASTQRPWTTWRNVCVADGWLRLRQWVESWDVFSALGFNQSCKLGKLGLSINNAKNYCLKFRDLYGFMIKL